MTLLDNNGQVQDQEIMLVDLPAWAEGQRATNGIPVIRADDDWESLLDKLKGESLVAIDFASMADGRGFSTSRLLKERHGFDGKLVAVGDVLVDQLYSLKRCGFDLFWLREDQVVESAFNALNAFTSPYQGANDDSRPHYRRTR